MSAFGFSSLGDPFAGAGAGQFGFEVPKGDPGAIESAGREWRTLGERLMTQGQDLRSAAQIAVQADGGWLGTAAGAYANYSSSVIGALAANADGCGEAAGALSALGTALQHAQQITRQAMAECQRAQGEQTTQQQLASDAASRASTAAHGLQTAVHPGQRTQLQSDLTQAGQAQSTAQGAANRAGQQLQDAQRRGRNACEAYAHQVQAATGKLLGAGGMMRPIPPLGGGAPVPITVKPSDISLAGGFALGGVAASPLGVPFGDTHVTPAQIEAIIAQERETLLESSPNAANVPERVLVQGLVPGGAPTTDDWFGIATGGAAGYLSTSAGGQIASDRSLLRRLASQWAAQDEAAGGAAGAAGSAGDPLASEMGQIVARRAGLRATANFADHFLGFGIGGVGDAALHIAGGENVPKAAAQGAGAAVGGAGGTAVGAWACGDTVVLIPIAPVCGGVGGAVGGWLGDKVGGLIADL